LKQVFASRGSLKLATFFLLSGILSAAPLGAQEVPYFVTYSHHMEEPGSLEVETKSAVGRPPGGNRFIGNATEFEYGTTAWWTTEVYVDTTHTFNESTVFGGFRIENRVRPLLREHWINPVLYAEFEDINGADKSITEVVGHDGKGDFNENTNVLRADKQREMELKLILSSDAKGWNFSENIISEKNFDNSPWEFGYAVAASRPLRLRGAASPNAFSPQNFTAGAEMYGGLGDRYTSGLHNTSQCLGPVAGWQIPNGPRLSFSPSFGLNDYSLDHIFRVGVAYEVGQIGRIAHFKKSVSR
jgi:hypothetical protein